MKASSLYNETFAGLDSEHIVLTVNQRLALHLQNEYAQYQLKQTKTVWQGNIILSFSAWLDLVWQRLGLLQSDLPLVLNCHQEKSLWHEIIQHSELGKNFLHIAGTVSAAQQAWQAMQQWCLDIHDIPSYYTDDVEAFIGWAKAFKKKCHQANWISSCERLGILSSALSQSELAVLFPKQLTLIGFDEYTPQLVKFCDNYKDSGRQVIEFKPTLVEASVQVKACHDKEAELRHAMTWAVTKLQSEPKADIAIVVPDLAQIRDEVERLAAEIIDKQVSVQHQSAKFYNIAAAKALSDYPIVADALEILKLRQLQDYEHFSRILRSPFLIAGEAEAFSRAQLDIDLRKHMPAECYLKSCLIEMRYINSSPLLVAALEQYLDYPVPKKAYLAEWIDHFKQALNIVAWPGERGLSSYEYQTVTRFYEVLDELPSLSLLLGACSYQKALGALEQVMRDTLFQPESSAYARISLLGVLEASGLPFDSIWLCGLSDDKWPGPASPSPFLPISLQVQNNMPHASAERERRYAAELMQNMRQHCHSLVLSYPCWADDIALNPSPLLQPFEAETCPSISRYCESLFDEGKHLEYSQDHYGLALQAADQIKAGSGLFKDQSLCPFRGYATKRLEVEKFPEFITYLDPSIQGNIVHSILQHIWAELKSSDRLYAQSDSDLTKLIMEKVSNTLRVYQKRYSHLLGQALLDLEQQRLVELMQAWLECEKQRSAFKVLALEQSTLTEMGGIPLELRIDRVDELSGGMLAVIDYKTGRASVKDWESDRMSSPQLPLYAVVKNARATVFAKVNATDKKGFDGLAVEAGLIPGVKKVEDWNQRLSLWKDQLLKLADEFKQGYAIVRPKSIAEACTNCGLERLCRVDFQNIDQGEADE